MLTIAKKFVTDDSAATLVEYALILALISVVAIGVMTTVGTRLTTIFTNVGNDL